MTIRECILTLGLTPSDKVLIKSDGIEMSVNEIILHQEWLDKDIISSWTDGINTVIEMETVL